MRKKGLTILEVLVSAVIFSLLLLGLVNIFISVKRHLLHTQSMVAGGELGKVFLDPLNMNVNQSKWSDLIHDYTTVTATGLQLSTEPAGRVGPVQRVPPSDLSGFPYTPTYHVTRPSMVEVIDPNTAMRKMRVVITWRERTS